MTAYNPHSPFHLNRKDARRRMDLVRMKISQELSLQKAVDVGLNQLRELSSKARPTMTAEALLLTLRDLLEHVDAADVLVREGSVGPARILARTVLELGAGSLYLAQQNDERMSAAKLLQALRAMEQSMKTVVRSVPVMQAEGRRVLAALRKDRINDEHSDYAKLVAAKALDANPGVPWHAAMGGPQSIAQLLNAVGLASLYDRFYVPWSSIAHGVWVVDTKAHDPQRAIRPLRHYSAFELSGVMGFLAMFTTLVGAVTQNYILPSPHQVPDEAMAQLRAAVLSLPGEVLLAVGD